METDRGYDPAVLDEIVARGWPSLAIADLAIVMEEAGAALLCAPLLGTAVARAAVGGDWDPGAIVALALAEDSGRWEAEAVTLAATPSPTGGGWLLDGHKSFVVDGWVADTLLVAGRTAPTAASPCSWSTGTAPAWTTPAWRPWISPASRPGWSSRARPVGWSATRAPSSG